MYRVIVKGRHDAIAEVCNTVDWVVAKYTYDYYIKRDFAWVIVNQRVNLTGDYWVTRLSSPAVMKGE